MSEWVRVVSTAVVALRYDEESESLDVEFPSPLGSPKRIFRYSPIARRFYERFFEDGASVGKLVHGLRLDPGVVCVRVPNDPPTLRPAEPVHPSRAPLAAKEAS